MTELAPTIPKRPSAPRLALAVAYLIGLVCLFYQSWKLVIWYIWFRFDPEGEGKNLSSFAWTRAGIATCLVWAILVAVAWKFVVNVFSSHSPRVVIVRQIFSAVIMMAVGRWICGFSIIFGWHVPPLWNPNYNWLPDFSLIPLVAAFTLFVLGSVCVADFYGYPLWQVLPATWKVKALEAAAPLKRSVPSGPKHWGPVSDFAKLVWLQWFRTIALIYVLPFVFGAMLVWPVWFAYTVTTSSDANWNETGVLMHGVAFAVVPIFFLALTKYHHAAWIVRGLWIGAVIIIGCWVVGHRETARSQELRQTCDAYMILVCMGGSLLSAIATAQDNSREFWGRENDQRFIGIGVSVDVGYELYVSMVFRMLRPYAVSLAIFAILTFLPIQFDLGWLVIAWPIAAVLHAFVFRRLTWFEAAPYHFRHFNADAGNVQDFVKSS